MTKTISIASTDQITLAREKLRKIIDGREVSRGEGDHLHTEVESLPSEEIETLVHAALAALDATPQPAPVPVDAELDELGRRLRTYGGTTAGEAAKALSALRWRLAEAEADRQRDVGFLIANIRHLEECLGEPLRAADAAVVAQIEAALRSRLAEAGK